MAVELLTAVRSAEEKADQIRREAAEQAREIIKSVEEATLDASRQTAAEIRAAYQEKMNERRAAVEKQIAGKAGEKQASLVQLKEAALKKAPQAAALIVERVLGHGNR